MIETSPKQSPLLSPKIPAGKVVASPTKIRPYVYFWLGFANKDFMNDLVLWKAAVTAAISEFQIYWTLLDSHLCHWWEKRCAMIQVRANGGGG